MAFVTEEAVAAHNELAFKLQQELSDLEINQLKNLFKDCPLSQRQITNIKDINDLFVHLRDAVKISIGDYDHLTLKLRLIKPRMADYVAEQEKHIQGILNRDDMSAATASTVSKSHTIEIHADLRPLSPLIVQTINRIKTEKEEKKFMETKAFHDAQEKLRKNRVIMIKGNTGDGKTSTAIQLMDWLIKEQQCRQPLQLHEIKKLDKLSPDSNLVTFIDDIFGEKNVRNTDVDEWTKRINNVKTLFVDQQIKHNFLLVTIRNEIYNVLKKRSLEPVFTKDNIIDLSSDTYRILEERKELLKKYLPNNFEWEEKEIENIVKSASSIGFPQCCYIFYNSVELQAKGGNFFEKPFKFLNEALSRLPECCAILFLFLNGGKIKVKDLDPNSDKINKTLLDESFDINLIDGEEDRTSLTYKKKVGFVKESLDRLLGFLVVKEKHWSGYDVYRFNHDSVHVTVARLYWNKTPVGYMQNCPVKSLCYLTTSKTSSDMIVKSSDHYTCLCERLLRELEWEVNYDEIDFLYRRNVIKSLDVWKDPVFVVRFVQFLNKRKIDKRAVLNKACKYGVKECGLYLLSVEVKPDNDTDWWSLITGGYRGKGDVDVLKKVVKYLNDKMKHRLLNIACESGSTECGLYLLSVGVKPDNDTDLWSLITGGYCGKGDVNVLKEVVKYLNDEKKHRLLNDACESGSTECGLYLLSVGAKPDNDTHWWSLITGGDEWDKGDVDVLKEVVKYLNDEKKHRLLNIACRTGSTECVLYLLSMGAKPDNDTHWWSLITGGDIAENVDVLKKLVKYLNDEMKHRLLNDACKYSSSECVLYLLSVGVKPDNETLFRVADGGSAELLRKLLQYDVTITAKDGYDNYNVLHKACESGNEEMVTELCDKYPDLVRDTDKYGRTPLHVATGIFRGNLSVFQTVERTILQTLYKQCGTDGNVVHRDCVWGQHMSHLVDNKGRTVLHESCWRGNKELCVYLCDKYPSLLTAVDNEGQTVLHWSCEEGNKDICVYLCEKYPSLITAVDKRGRHCLHYIAESYKPDVDLFTECETYVKRHIESTGGKYDITTILDGEGKSVLELVKQKKERYSWKDNRLYDHLIKVFRK
ncbi:LOW QUALITY PROTEIN: uncharacterized protein LOC132556257 [Ylistrum balloti]|uniref:LOW QUALITY PROTEIN: uncharacterized protein LOC132556257 n=1 Tax=Ylistrum balloti TaxID=509963 RepID=UPI0029059C15|nr:LOW QUALITY PROTEIN: uncharacterized protein LOC132556257 [Ylistrum balloti]